MDIETAELVPESPYVWRAPRPGHARRLICFPHAGAGAAAYADWVRWLPPGVELAAVQLPGRQNRIAEEPFAEVAPLVNVLVHALRPVLDGPFAFFGHSCGAALAYELAQALRSRGRRGPERLFLSAQPAPGRPGIRRLHDLPDEEFRAEMIRLGGIAPEIAADEDVMGSLLAVLRADFALWERHRMEPGPPLDCPITVLAGTSDPRAPVETLGAWRAFTTAGFGMRRYEGGHFYFLESVADVVAFIGERTLSEAMDGRAR
ncbi:thioesterase [Actinomadura spongiicola]|uniref:Thioesterase n=1 Tax=Actinomadura spongiicola TaxID=2303421 RepID=A0A372GGB5_9ACTN|nr:alpha/beta fold hydrolase [Actinomadura spongiicola]RFS84426.1 thioesterase [Actinomadura spongiicola]